MPGLAHLGYPLVIMAAMLRVMHPQLFFAGLTAMRTLEARADFAEYARAWPSVFSSVQVISNRTTQAHRDTKGVPEWLDVLGTFGTYASATLRLPQLNLTAAYGPGSIVALSGMMVEHGVDWDREDGERVCLACYMIDAVHQWLEVECPGWAKV